MSDSVQDNSLHMSEAEINKFLDSVDKNDPLKNGNKTLGGRLVLVGNGANQHIHFEENAVAKPFTYGTDLKKIASFCARNGITNNRLKEFMERCNQIASSTLFGKCIINKADIDSLERIEFQYNRVTVKELNDLLIKHPNVTTIHLNYCKLTDECIEVVKKFKKLQRLQIIGNEKLTSKSMKHLLDMKALKSVSFAGCPEITRCNLEELDSQGISEAVYHGVATFLQDKRAKGKELTKQENQVLERADQLLNVQFKEKPVSFIDAFRIAFIMEVRLPRLTKGGLITEEDTLFNHVLQRANQLMNAQFEEDLLPPNKAFQIAFFIEERLSQLAKKGEDLFKKKVYNLPRTVLFSPIDGGRIYILSKYEKSLFKGSGTSKKVSAAVGLQFNEFNHAPMYAYAVMCGHKSHVTMREAEIGNDLKESPYIVCPHTAQAHKTAGKAKDIQTVRFIFDFYNGGSIEKLSHAAERLSWSDMITLAKGAATGIRDLHKKGYVHADIKNENILFIRNEKTGAIEKTAIGDLDLAFRLTEGPRWSSLRTYGSLAYTSPEFFRDPLNWKTEDYQKTDVFAFGAVLYQQYFKAKLPWEEDLNKNYSRKVPLKETREILNNKIEKAVEESFKKLSETMPRTREQEMELLIYKLLRLNPNDRITMETFVEELTKIEGMQL